MADSSSPALRAVDTSTQSFDDSVGAAEPAVSPRAVLPDRVGRYKIRRLLGEGGMGAVFLARDLALGRSVAIKLIKRRGRSEAEVERFLTEARTTAKLNHPHVVVVYDVGEQDGAPYLALEYLQGESLRQRLEREPLSKDEALRVLAAVAGALEHAHAAGVWHCDLKPGNVVMSSDGRPRVVDFGLARGGGDANAGPAGTPDYMAPEQWTASALSAKVDTWALAVIAFELFAGRHPFGPAASRSARRESTLLGLEAKVADPDVPASLRALLHRSLAREPDARPTATAWREALDALLSGSPDAEQSPYRGLAPFQEEHASAF